MSTVLRSTLNEAIAMSMLSFFRSVFRVFFSDIDRCTITALYVAIPITLLS